MLNNTRDYFVGDLEYVTHAVRVTRGRCFSAWQEKELTHSGECL